MKQNPGWLRAEHPGLNFVSSGLRFCPREDDGIKFLVTPAEAVGRDKALPFPACQGLACNASLMQAYVPRRPGYAATKIPLILSLSKGNVPLIQAYDLAVGRDKAIAVPGLIS